MSRHVKLGMLNVVFTTMPLEERRSKLLRMLDEAGESGCKVVLFPEFADHHRCHEALAAHKSGQVEEVRRVCGFRLDSPWMKEVAKRAKKYKLVAIPEVMLQDGKKWFNSAVVYGPEGTVLGQYRKTHLPCGEEKFFEAGAELKPVQTPFGRLGIMICYDRNFPEIARSYELQGAEILLWTTMRQGELEENLYKYVLPATAVTHALPYGVATFVTDDQVCGRQTMASVIYNCFGQVVAGGLQCNGVVSGTVDLDERVLERRSWEKQQWLDSASYLRRRRRPELYGAITRPLSKEESDPGREPTLIKAKNQ